VKLKKTRPIYIGSGSFFFSCEKRKKALEIFQEEIASSAIRRRGGNNQTKKLSNREILAVFVFF